MTITEVNDSGRKAADPVGGSITTVADRVPAALPRGGWRAVRRGKAGMWAALVIALFSFPLFIGLGATDLDNDEAIHALVVERMVYAADWLTPKSGPESHFIEKPPLKFWMVSAPIRLGLLPYGEFGLRFWDALMAGVAFLYVFAIGRRLGGPVCGLAALVILFAHETLLFQHGLRSHNMESAMFLAYSAGVYHFMAWSAGRSQTGRQRHIFALALYLAGAFMVKFVAILFLPLMLAVMVVCTGELRTRLRQDWRAWAVAAGMAAALAFPWYLYELHRFGVGAWNIIVGQHVVTRFTTYLDPNHVQAWHFYWTSMYREFSACGAIAAAIAGLLAMSVATLARPSRDRAVVLLWLVLPLGLMSLLSSKLYHYSYPYLPPVALAGGYLVAHLVRVVWARADGPCRQLDQILASRLPRALMRPAARRACGAVAVAALAIGVATIVAGGRLRLTIGDTMLLQNSSAVRALLVAALMLLVAARFGSALRVGAAALVVASLLPITGYARDLARLSEERHPLRSLGQCMGSVAERAHPEHPPGVWAEADTLAHFYYYYFRGATGPWQFRQGIASDATVYTKLYIEETQSPVLLSTKRYEEFTRTMNEREPELVERVGRKTGLDAATLRAGVARTYVAHVPFAVEMLLLPGPYSYCGVMEREWTPSR